MHNFKSLIRKIVERFPSLASTLRAIRDQRLLLREAVRTPHGFLFSGKVSMEQGTFEREETEVVTRLLEKTDLFINVGANIGYYVCHALQAGVPTLAFEPVPSNVQLLYRNVSLNGWDKNIEIFPIALGQEGGVSTIYGSGTAASLVKGYSNISEHYVTRISVNTLDAVIGHRYTHKQCLFLVDVEGYEFPLLLSATENLSRQPAPWWLMEINITNHQVEGLTLNPYLMSTFERMWDLGYNSWTADTQPTPVNKAQVQKIIVDKYNHLGTHNFIFAKLENLPSFLTL